MLLLNEEEHERLVEQLEDFVLQTSGFDLAEDAQRTTMLNSSEFAELHVLIGIYGKLTGCRKNC